jgi:hypothetical protein
MYKQAHMCKSSSAIKDWQWKKCFLFFSFLRMINNLCRQKRKKEKGYRVFSIAFLISFKLRLIKYIYFDIGIPPQNIVVGFAVLQGEDGEWLPPGQIGVFFQQFLSIYRLLF